RPGGPSVDAVRIGCDADLPRRENRPLFAAGSGTALPDAAMGDVPDGKYRPDDWPVASLQIVSAGEARLPDPPLRRRIEATARRTRNPAVGIRVAGRPRVHDRRHLQLVLVPVVDLHARLHAG